MHKFYSWPSFVLVLYSLILLVDHVLDSREQLALQQSRNGAAERATVEGPAECIAETDRAAFLFNTLNAIAGLVREKRNDAAVSMIVGLSDFLRRVVDDSDRQQVPLGERKWSLRRSISTFRRCVLPSGSSSAWTFPRNFFRRRFPA